MKALLLAGGLGTSLRPLTDSVPKCLVPVKGVPLLKIWLDSLIQSGLDSFLINTHYLSEQVEHFIKNEGFRNVELVYEENLLGTAGTLIENIDFFEGQDGLLIHADNYCTCDLTSFINAHNNRPKGCLLTMMTFRTETPSSCGIIQINKSNIVLDFQEKTKEPLGNLANGAVYILSPELLKLVKTQYANARDFSTEIIPNFLGSILSYEVNDTFLDIGTLETYEKANLS